MNLERLRDKIKEIDIPISTISSKIGLSRQSFYLKLNGKREFKTNEIESLCNILRLTPAERSTIFFTK